MLPLLIAKLSETVCKAEALKSNWINFPLLLAESSSNAVLVGFALTELVLVPVPAVKVIAVNGNAPVRGGSVGIVVVCSPGASDVKPAV